MLIKIISYILVTCKVPNVRCTKYSASTVQLLAVYIFGVWRRNLIPNLDYPFFFQMLPGLLSLSSTLIFAGKLLIFPANLILFYFIYAAATWWFEVNHEKNASIVSIPLWLALNILWFFFLLIAAIKSLILFPVAFSLSIQCTSRKIHPSRSLFTSIKNMSSSYEMNGTMGMTLA